MTITIRKILLSVTTVFLLSGGLCALIGRAFAVDCYVAGECPDQYGCQQSNSGVYFACKPNQRAAVCLDSSRPAGPGTVTQAQALCSQLFSGQDSDTCNTLVVGGSCSHDGSDCKHAAGAACR